MPHPCCGYSLRNGAIIIAIIDMIGAVVGALTTVASILIFTCYKESLKEYIQNEMKDPDSAKMLEQHSMVVLGMLTFMVVICLMDLALAWLLLKGARQVKLKKCVIWWRIRIALLILSLMVVLTVLLYSREHVHFGIFSFVGIVYELYSLWIVKAFMNEIRYGTTIPTAENEFMRKL